MGTTAPDASLFDHDLASGNVGSLNVIVPNDCADGHDLCGTRDRIRQFDDSRKRDPRGSSLTRVRTRRCHLHHLGRGLRPALSPSPHPDRDPRTTGTSRRHRPRNATTTTDSNARSLNRPGADGARPCPRSHANHHDLALTAPRFHARRHLWRRPRRCSFSPRRSTRARATVSMQRGSAPGALGGRSGRRPVDNWWTEPRGNRAKSGTEPPRSSVVFQHDLQAKGGLPSWICVCLPCRRSRVRVPSAASERCPPASGFSAFQPSQRLGEAFSGRWTIPTRTGRSCCARSPSGLCQATPRADRPDSRTFFGDVAKAFDTTTDDSGPDGCATSAVRRAAGLALRRARRQPYGSSC